MKKLIIKTNQSVNDLVFGTDRSVVRKTFGSAYKEIKKTPFSVNTIDVYADYHIYYTSDNKFEAIEIFGNVIAMANGIMVFPAEIDAIKNIFPGIVVDEWGGYIDKDNSIGITVSTENNKIETILFARKGYYA